jgi:hypothetical protein
MICSKSTTIIKAVAVVWAGHYIMYVHLTQTALLFGCQSYGVNESYTQSAYKDINVLKHFVDNLLGASFYFLHFELPFKLQGIWRRFSK